MFTGYSGTDDSTWHLCVFALPQFLLLLRKRQEWIVCDAVSYVRISRLSVTRRVSVWILRKFETEHLHGQFGK